MPTVRDQIELEQTFLKRSAEKYYTSQDKLRTKKQTDQTDAARYVMQEGIIKAAEILEYIVNYKVRGIGAQYNQLVKLAASRVDKDTGEIYYDYNSIVYLALTVLFRSMSTRNTNLTHLKASLSSVLEADAKARLFEAAYPGYYFTVMKSMKEQGVTDYVHIHKVVMTKFRHFEMQWKEWNTHQTNAVAQKILNAILSAMPTIFFKNTIRQGRKTISTIDTTVAADEWFADYEKERGLINPSLPPMIIPPIDWSIDNDGQIEGGYLTPRMCISVPFVKARSTEHQEFIRNNPPKEHINAVNKMQKTAWTINKDVYEVQKQIFKTGKGGVGIPSFLPRPLLEFPEHLKTIPVEHLTEEQQAEIVKWKIATKEIHTANRLNKSKVIAYKMTYDGASDYLNAENLYFVYNMDFRGRVYCATSGLSPQGNDLAKSLLQFADGVRVGSTGLDWLAIHGANTFGYDKVSNDDRIKWAHDNAEKFMAVAESPLDTTPYWGSADKPWQFLAFVFEWAKADFGKNRDYISKIPIGLDGSCNGIQHYSAILRDSVGGAGVNLKNSEIPSDIYQDVADELVRILKNSFSSDPKARIWLKSNITRKLTKRPVMTLPYGSTQQSAKQYILEWMSDSTIPQHMHQSMAVFLTPILWKAIGNVVIASRTAMSWIQKQSSRTLRKHGKPLQWLSPSGFPVYQDYYKSKRLVIDSMMMGEIAVTSHGTVSDGQRIQSAYQIPTGELDLTRQRSGIAPNFIHSIDASHMIKTINACDDRIQHFAMIHDDFGTHAGNTQYLWKTIREQFVKMYTEHAPLEDWYRQQNMDDTEQPQMGNLDIEEVLNSTYFFG